MNGVNENNEVKTRLSRNIKNLYLDPNNYRFVDNKDYVRVLDEHITDERVQRRTRSFIEGNKLERIKDLVDSFKANGFLKVDVIQATDLGNNNFLVIEGNRRVTALKYLQDQYRKGFSIGKLNPDIFGSVPFEIHEKEDVENHLIIMGLKHISGNKKWAAINQAQLIYDYLFRYKSDKVLYQEKESELCASLAISKQKLRTSQRAYHLIQSYIESDYGDQFSSDMFSIFEESVKKPSLKEWLSWDDSDYIARNKMNLERFFSWISTVEETEDDEEKLEEDRIREPIITKAFEIRDLATFIDNEAALLILEDTKSVGRALQASGTEDRNSIDKSIQTLKVNVKTIRRFTDVLENEDINNLNIIHDEINDILPQRVKLDISSSNATNCFQLGDINHFDKITLESYKVFSNFEIDRLNRINIIAGTNNSGKTTLLEAIYLLCNQNDVASLFDLTKSRGKVQEIDPHYLKEGIGDKSRISGKFNNFGVSLLLEKYEDPEVDKLDDYVTSIKMDGRIDEQNLSTTIHTYEFNAMKREYQQIQHICNSFLSSPYMYNIDKLVALYNKTLETKIEGILAYDLVIDFVKKIDPSIQRIFYTEDQGQKKFVVDSSKFTDRNVDLTSYGEGIFRVFELALSFASCKNGVLLIDEFETAIHYSLLIEFTKFVQKLAIKFNVQVFLTTHSKECIDAFVKNEYHNEDISAYLISSNLGN